MSAEEQIFREFLQTYNRIVEECFNRCVFTFNYRYLLDEEIDCTARCTTRYVNYNQRVAMNFAQLQTKKMIDAEEQNEAQQLSTPLSNPTATSDSPKS